MKWYKVYYQDWTVLELEGRLEDRGDGQYWLYLPDGSPLLRFGTDEIYRVEETEGPDGVPMTLFSSEADEPATASPPALRPFDMVTFLADLRTLEHLLKGARPGYPSKFAGELLSCMLRNSENNPVLEQLLKALSIAVQDFVKVSGRSGGGTNAAGGETRWDSVQLAIRSLRTVPWSEEKEPIARTDESALTRMPVVAHVLQACKQLEPGFTLQEIVARLATERPDEVLEFADAWARLIALKRIKVQALGDPTTYIVAAALQGSAR